MEDEFEEIEDPVEDDEALTPDEPGEDDEVSRKLESFEKTKKGLLTALTSERKKRQELEGRVNQITEMVASAKEKKTQPKSTKGIPIQFDEDGNAFVPTDILSTVVEQNIKPIKEQINQSAMTAQQATAANAAMSTVQSLMAENPSYQKAMNSVNDQWEWVKTALEEKAATNQLPQNPEDIIDYALNSDIADEFRERFPTSDMELLVEAFSTNHIGTMKRKLRGLLKRNATESKGMPTKLKVLAGKPQFGTARNKRTTSAPTLDDIADMDMEDFLSMSDSEIRKIESALRRQEG